MRALRGCGWLNKRAFFLLRGPRHCEVSFVLGVCSSSVCLALRCVGSLMLCGTSCLVPYRSDVKVCGFSVSIGEFPFGREPSPWERDWSGCPQAQMLCSHQQPRCMTVSERERDLLPLRWQLTLPAGLSSWRLSLRCAPRLCRQLVMGSCNHLLGLSHRCCNPAILWTSLSIRSGNTALDKQFLPLFPSCGRRAMVSTELGSKFTETEVQTFISCGGFWIRSCFN